MVEPGARIDLAEEPLGTQPCSQLGPENLDGDVAMVSQIFREIDHRHAALTQQADNAISLGNSGCYALQQLRRSVTQFVAPSAVCYRDFR
jgi:hypothetical protein